MRVVVVSVIALAGCESLPRKDVTPGAEPVAVPEASAANRMAAERADRIGKQILAANPFGVVCPGFHVIGSETPIVFHRDQTGIFVSDGLVAKCRSDDELAGVLCSELAAVTAERRNLQRMGFVDDTQEKPSERMPGDERGEVRPGQARPLATSDDPQVIAREMFDAAGFKSEAFAPAQALVRAANGDRKLLEQLAGGSRAPTWTR